MTKKSFETTAHTFKRFTFSELSDKEIISLLEKFSPNPDSGDCPEDELRPTLGEICETESQLFTQITASLSKTGMPYGQAVLMLAIYATTIEDRVRMALMC